LIVESRESDGMTLEQNRAKLCVQKTIKHMRRKKTVFVTDVKHYRRLEGLRGRRTFNQTRFIPHGLINERKTPGRGESRYYAQRLTGRGDDGKKGEQHYGKRATTLPGKKALGCQNTATRDKKTNGWMANTRA